MNPFIGPNKAARIREFGVQNLANIGWAFAMAGQSDASLFEELAKAAEQCVGDLNAKDFNAKELANTG